MMLDGFLAEVELDEAENLLRGTVINAPLLIIFAGRTIGELRSSFAGALEEYRSKVEVGEIPGPAVATRPVSLEAFSRMVTSASVKGRHRAKWAPNYQTLQEAYDNLLSELYMAADQFKQKGDDGKAGAILACDSVALFIARRWEHSELASPFLHLSESIKDVLEAKDAPLFSKSVSGRLRPRSRAGHFQSMWAAALLDAKMRFEGDLDVAANEVALHCRQWPGLVGVNPKAITVINWRTKWRGAVAADRRQFDRIVEDLCEGEKPRQTITHYLRQGPPGTPKNKKPRGLKEKLDMQANK